MRHDETDPTCRASGFDLDALLHPAQAFTHPSEVLRDSALTLNEKRAILASWASDACAIEAMPEMRRSASGPPVRFDDIMEALRMLDRQAAAAGAGECAPRKARRRALFSRGRSDRFDDRGPMLG